jgi:hypothetical protein
MYQPPVELYARISPLLQEKLSPEDADVLRRQLSDLEAIRYELSYTRCEWLEKLLRERERARMPKEKDYTELDRKTMLGASTSVIESDYNFLVALEGIVKERIELGIMYLQTMV